MTSRIPQYDTTKRSNKRFKYSKPYWNDELHGLWNSMRVNEKAFVNYRENNQHTQLIKIKT